MRHLSQCRLPPFSHDPTRSVFRSVRPLSATTAELSDSGWSVSSSFVAASPQLSSVSKSSTSVSPLRFSPAVALPVNSMVFSRLSRRQMRQREQKWGALWRYRPDNCPLPRTQVAPLLIPTPLSEINRRAGIEVKTTKSRQQAAESSSFNELAGFVALGGQSSFAEREATRSILVTADFKEKISPNEQPHFDKALDVEGERENGTVFYSSSSVARGKAGSAAQRECDPLLAFLETHDEDAADLLAMWTALHRSCVYASALSESVVLQVRYFFHSLLHNRAIAAAMEFYYRLMGLGVQLQQSDLLLLLASLPYEHATATEAEQLQKAQESAAMEKDRQLWAKRRQEFKEAAPRTQAGTSKAVAHNAARDSRHEGTSDKNRVNNSTHAAAAAAEREQKETTTVSAGTSEEREANLPSFIAQRVAFQRQPEWIKRWILYEASMGMLDSLDTEEGTLVLSSTENKESSLGSVNNTLTNTGDLVWSSNTASDIEAALQSQRASCVMELAAILDHLRLLTLGAMQRDAPMLRTSSHESTTRHTSSTFSSASLAHSGFSVRMVTQSSVEKLYWREALRVVRNSFAAPVWTTPASSYLVCTSPADPLILSGEIATILQCMMRDAYTWEGALALLRLRVPSKSKHRQPPRGLTMEEGYFQKGALLFTALAAASQPWKTQASVEEWMHQCMLPRLAEQKRSSVRNATLTTDSDAGALAAIYALWLSHLCGVKAARPEQFIAMADDAADYLPALIATKAPESNNARNTAQLLHSGLSVMIAEVQAKAEASVVALRRNVREGLLSRRAAEALAKSIQSGAYRLDVEEDDKEMKDSRTPMCYSREENAALGNSAAKVTSTQAASPTTRTMPAPPLSSSALLSEAQVDAFVLCCAAIKETVWLRFRTSALQDRASVTAEVLQFLEQSLYGNLGLYALYRDLYGGHTLVYQSESFYLLSSGSGIPAAAASPPERPLVSAVLAVTLLELTQLLCTPTLSPHRFGNQLTNRDTLRLLVEMARRAVDGVQPALMKVAPWRWAAEARASELIVATARTLHIVVRELDVQPKNEKVMFGAVPQRDLQLLAELARVLIKTSDLAPTTTSALKPRHKLQRECDGEEVRSPVWKVLTATASPRVLQGVRLCFCKSSSLGKRVRHQLTSHEAERLDALLGRSRRAHGGNTNNSRNSAGSVSNVPWRMQGLDAGLVPHTHVTESDFALAITIRSAVYNVVKREATTAGVRAALQRFAAAATNWKASLRLCQLATKDMALARGTCDINFFVTVLTKMTSDLSESKAVAAAAQQRNHGVKSGSRIHRNQRRVRSAEGTTVPLVAVGPSSLWLSAIDVFWSAVDHTAGTPAAPAEQLFYSETQTPVEQGQGKSSAIFASATAAEKKQERAVLSQLLLPLIDLSRTINRADLGREWRRTWAAKYSAAEKHTPSFQRQNILALSALRDTSALERCVSSYAQLGYDSALLCHVVAQHRDWHQALQALTNVYGTIEKKEQSQSVYPLTVAHTFLELLSRSPKNLSNTAMRLETLQGETWDSWCSALVVRLLLRARRWSLALQHVDAALTQQPALHRIHASITSASTVTSSTASTATSVTAPSLSEPRVLLSPQEALPYVTLLTLGLQAAAIGGDSETAPHYYDALKLTLQYVFERSQTSHSAMCTVERLQPTSASTSAESRLNTVFEMTSPATMVPDANIEHAGRKEDRCRVELRELSARARLLFFRAMTKKMMSTKSNAAGLDVQDDNDDVGREADEEKTKSSGY